LVMVIGRVRTTEDWHVALTVRNYPLIFNSGWLYFYRTDDGIGFVSEEEKQRRKNIMPKVVKVIELLSESPTSWEEAAKNVVKEASKTLRNIRSVYIKEFTVAVENDKVASYRINAKVTFDLEKDRSGK